MKRYAIGVDIGSTCAKAVVLDRDGAVLERLLLPTGWSSVDIAETLRGRLAEWMGDAAVVSTGYGRVCVPYADRAVTEITCHAKGACFIHGTGDLAVVDIGGQDTKVIRVEGGLVGDFLMNDKCSAGTGRFLEVMANTLGVRPEELCALASRGGGATISSMCTVFAESEVISLIGRGEARENIAFAVVDSIVTKVASQAARLLSNGRAKGEVCLTGGLCDFDYLRESLARALGRPVLASPDGRFAGAIGAALTARGIAKQATARDAASAEGIPGEKEAATGEGGGAAGSDTDRQG